MLRAAAAFCWPQACAVCERLLRGTERDALCGLCLARLAPLGAPRCDRCGHPGIRSSCTWCATLDMQVHAARSAYWMGAGSAGDMIHAFKYQGWHVLGRALGERMARLVDVRGDALVAVPLSRARERERGYNQSAILAEEIARRTGIPAWNGALMRTRHTRTQTALTPQRRSDNVAGAFAMVDAFRTRCRGMHLILVDDVITTGATLNACAAAMFAAGVRSVAYLTFGRARAPGDRLP